MPRLLDGVPRYRKHRASGQAIVNLSGKDFYLGPHGTKVSHLEYDRVVAEWLARGRSLPPPDPTDSDSRPLSLVEITAAYKRYARDYYRKRGRVTNEYTAICSAMKVAQELYGRQPAAEFGPLKLQAVQQRMVQLDWSRKHINKQVSRLIRMFRWAASQELVPGQLPFDLRAVSGLPKGRTKARESEPVRPIADEIVNKTLPFLSRVVADMVRLQRLAGMRPEEVCVIRPMDIDRAADVWIYRPDSSKMEHLDVDRQVFLGPRAQVILTAWLDRSPDAYCFSPREAERERRAAEHRLRVVPVSYGNRPGSNRQQAPKREPGGRYTTDSYRRAIYRACDLMSGMPEELRVISPSLPAEVKQQRQIDARKWRRQHCWAPNRLRHATGTQVREQFGLEAAQLILGHSRADVTQIYAERNAKLAVDVARKLG
jgi:site-specific recombinase XerD